MKIGEIFSGIDFKVEHAENATQIEVRGLEYDSRRVEPGCLFFALRGAKTDGRLYAEDALKRGAVAVAGDQPAPEGFPAPWILVEDARRALAVASRNFFSRPDESLVTVGITGTNGKTTTAFVLDSIFNAAGKTTALIGTIEYRIRGEKRSAPNTTPESLDLFRILAELEQAGGTHVTMEVSSHALALGRVFGLRFHTAVFTNLTRDHLDFHGTMEAYFAAKQMLFEGCGAPPPAWAAVNMDDPAGRRLKLAPSTRLLRYGVESRADVRAENISLGAGGLKFEMFTPAGRVAVRSALIGLINVYNLLAASSAALACGFDLATICAGIEQCRSVAGRFERIDMGQPFSVVVDYAHTDDALRNLIRAARSLSPNRVITVFGCGGDRDRTKRPLMGEAAAEGSDLVVLTSDNPRSEDPLAIMNDVMVGLRRYDVPLITEPDRRKAIRLALEEARTGDLVLVAGKGHETYQILADRTIPFDDREVVREVLREFGYRRTEK